MTTIIRFEKIYGYLKNILNKFKKNEKAQSDFSFCNRINECSPR